MTYLRYSPDIETLEKDEQETIGGIIKGMTHQSEVVEKREHPRFGPATPRVPLVSSAI